MENVSALFYPLFQFLLLTHLLKLVLLKFKFFQSLILVSSTVWFGLVWLVGWFNPLSLSPAWNDSMSTKPFYQTPPTLECFQSISYSTYTKLYSYLFLLNEPAVSSGQKLESHPVTHPSHSLSITMNHRIVSVLLPEYPPNYQCFSIPTINHPGPVHSHLQPRWGHRPPALGSPQLHLLLSNPFATK